MQLHNYIHFILAASFVKRTVEQKSVYNLRLLKVQII